MKPLIVMLSLLVVSVLLVFVAPHHRRVESVISKPRTLAGVYKDILSDALPALEDGIAVSSSARGVVWFLLLTAAAFVATTFPTIFVGLAKWWPAISGRGAIYVILGIIALIGAAANFLVMLVSQMTFGFGASDSSVNITPFIWIIPVFQAFFGIASIVAGSSGRVAGWLTYYLT